MALGIEVFRSAIAWCLNGFMLTIFSDDAYWKISLVVIPVGNILPLLWKLQLLGL